VVVAVEGHPVTAAHALRQQAVGVRVIELPEPKGPDR
jgi:hypothetical protein